MAAPPHPKGSATLLSAGITDVSTSKPPALTFENIMGALRGVNDWRELGDWLVFGSKSALQSIEQRYSSSQDRLQGAVLYWFDQRQPSWRNLIHRLDGAGMSEVADPIRSWAEPVRDPTLTVENASLVLQPVRDLDGLQICLSMPSSVMAKLSAKHTSGQELRLAAAEYYVRTVPWASWEDLADGLYRWEEEEAVQAVRKYYHAPRDPTLTSENVMAVLEEALDWDTFQNVFDIPWSEKREIEEHYQIDSQRKSVTLGYWLQRHPAPSWKWIARCLQGWGESSRLAEEVTTKYVRASEQSKQIFEKAMKSGHVKSRIFKFIIMGAAGVGKSHVLAMIVGEDPPGLRCSTPCLKRPVRVLRVGKKKGKDWKRMGGKEMSEMVAVAARHRLPDHDHKDDGMAAPPTPHHGSQQERKASSTTPLKNPQLVIDRSSLPVEHPSPEASPTLPSISAEDELLRRIEIKRDSDEVSEVDLICVVDSGGQPNFLEVLAAYLKNTTATLLVVKLSEDLSVCPVVEYYDEHGDLVGVPYRSAFTNAQTVRGCMRALQSQAMKSSEGTCPKVVFVGTHKDLEGTCDETREEKNAQLRDMVLPAVQDSVIYYGEEMKEVIFPVNAKAPGPEEKEIAANLRELLLEKSSVKPIDIPLQWYGLDFALQKLMEIQNRGVLSKTECLVEARRFHFDEASLEVALKFLSGLGTLHYYDAVLPEVVFVDPQVSLDKLTELVEYSYKLSEDPTACKLVCGDLRKFRDQGIVTLDILRGFPNHYIEGLFTACELLKLFKAQLYIAEVRPDQYFMPSLLRVAAGESKRTATINPILFYFPHGGPALGIFCGLVSFLLSIAKWRLLMELDTPTLVTRNRIAFEIPGGCPGTLTLGDSLSTHFEVSIYIPSEKCFNLCRKACPRIRQDIFTGIRKAASTLGYSNCIPREGFFCPVQSKACSHSPHPATVEGNCSLLKCTLNPGEVCSDLQGEHSVWFQPMDESCDTSSSADDEISATVPPATVLARHDLEPTTLSDIKRHSQSRLDTKPRLAQLKVMKTSDGNKVEIIKSVAPKWQEFGILLDFDADGDMLNLIEAEKKLNGPVACCQQMFRHWLAGNGRPATWGELVELLEDCELSHLADQIRNILLK